MKPILIAFFISVITLTVYAIPLPDSGIIRLPLTKRRSANYKRRDTYHNVEPNNVKLSDFEDSLYYVEITIGDQKFEVTLDTGSFDLWVPGTSCSDPACINHNRFDPSKSTTFQSTDKNITFKYLDGTSVDLDIGYDTISIGNAAVTDQVFGVAKTVAINLTSPSDGIMGFGPNRKGQLQDITLFYQLVEQSVVKDSVFGIYLGHVNDTTGSESELTLGGIDTSKFTGDIVYNEIVPDAFYWDIILDDALVDGASLELTKRVVTIDTGTTRAWISEPDLIALNEVIQGTIHYDSEITYTEIPCDFNNTVSFVIGGVAYDIKPVDLVLQLEDFCALTILAFPKSNVSEPWLLGDVFLRNVYTVLNVSDSTVGFAQLSN